MRELFYNHGNPQLLQRGNLRGDQTKNRAITIRLLEIVTPKARGPVHLVGKIEIAAPFKDLPIVRAANFTHHLNSFLACHLLRTDGHYVTMHPHLWRFSFADVQVGPAVLNNHAEKLIEVSHVRSQK